MLKDWFGRALRGAAIGPQSFNVFGCVELRLLDKLAPSRPSTPTADGDKTAVMGEYGRGVVDGDGENDETCKSITNSCVAFVNANILSKRSENTAWEVPCVLTTFDNLTTICLKKRTRGQSAHQTPHHCKSDIKGQADSHMALQQEKGKSGVNESPSQTRVHPPAAPSCQPLLHTALRLYWSVGARWWI